jgi:putative membrane protein
MLLIHPVVELIRSFPVLVGVALAGTSSGAGSLWSLAAVGLVIALALSRWFTTRYRIGAEQIQVRHGVLRRRTQAAPLDRVRTVDVTSHLLHRVLGLAKVSIGTGTSDRRGRGDLVLDGLDAGVAARLRGELLHDKPPTPQGTVPAVGESELFRLDPAWVRYAPFTLSGVLTAAALGGFLWRVNTEAGISLDRLGPLREVARQWRRIPLWAVVSEILTAMVAFVVLASVVGYVLSFWRFRLSRHEGGTLHVTRGLVTTRAISIEARRLRGIEISEPLLLRWAGGARCLAIATGLRVGRGSERGGSLLVPPSPRAASLRVAAEVLRTPEPVTTVLRAHGPVAQRRRLTRALLCCLVLAGAGWTLLWSLDAGAVSWLALLLVATAWPMARDRYRSLGHARAMGYLIVGSGTFVRRRYVIAEPGIVGWKLRRSLLQRRSGLMTLTAATAAGRQGYRIQDVEQAAALRLVCDCSPGLLEQFA